MLAVSEKDEKHFDDHTKMSMTTCPTCHRPMYLQINIGPQGLEPSTHECYRCGISQKIPGARVGWAKPIWAGYEDFSGPEEPDIPEPKTEPAKKPKQQKPPLPQINLLGGPDDQTETRSRRKPTK